RRQAFALFVPDAQVVAVGCDMAMVSFPFYFTYVFLEAFAGTSRGQGHAAPPMLITVINMCIIRTALLFLCMRIYHDAAGIVRIFPVTWVLNGACQGLYLLHVRRGQEIGDPEE
ncbi:MAG: MATE family efflux transporter, partial [Firmicutes bacterium]|nr:MATE family efflux transporter [Bacillota bacterium]